MHGHERASMKSSGMYGEKRYRKARLIYGMLRHMKGQQI